MQKQKEGCRFEDANNFQESKNRFQADANSFQESENRFKQMQTTLKNRKIDFKQQKTRSRCHQKIVPLHE